MDNEQDEKNYFATRDPKKLVAELEKKSKTYKTKHTSSGLFRKWLKSFRFYYGNHIKSGVYGTSDSEIKRLGSDGELAAFHVNHYRNLVRLTLSLVANEKPSYEPRAINSTPKSLQNAKLGGNILDYYMHKKQLGRYDKRVAEQALVLSKGYIVIDWNDKAGADYITDEMGNKVKQGDLEIINPVITECRIDPECKDFKKLNWFDCIEWVNRWDLVANTDDPVLKEKIKNYDSKKDYFDQISGGDAGGDNDYVPLKRFYHKPTPALPKGRHTKYLDAETVIVDHDYHLGDNLNLFRLVPAEVFSTCEGYTDFFDVLAINEAYNTVISTIFTNYQAFGVQKVWMPGNCDLTATQMSENLAFLKGGTPDSKPQSLDLVSIPDGSFKLLDVLEGSVESSTGMNAAMRGKPEANLKSGTALARVQSMAIQYISEFQGNYVEFLEESGTFILEVLKLKANTERMIDIVGTSRAHAVQEHFSAENLKDVGQVIVNIGNPLSRTGAGRIDLAEMLIEKGLIKTAQDFLQVIQTGNIDAAIEGPERHLDLINKENEMLRKGQSVLAMVGDAHLLHMQKHADELADPGLRDRANAGDEEAVAIMSAVTEHVLAHAHHHETQLPIWSQVAGEPAAPPKPPMPPQGGPPQGPPMPPPPQGELPGLPSPPPIPPEIEEMPQPGIAPPPIM